MMPMQHTVPYRAHTHTHTQREREREREREGEGERNTVWCCEWEVGEARDREIKTVVVVQGCVCGDSSGGGGGDK